MYCTYSVQGVLEIYIVASGPASRLCEAFIDASILVKEAICLLALSP